MFKQIFVIMALIAMTSCQSTESREGVEVTEVKVPKSHDIKYEQVIYIKSTKEKIWNALTKADIISKYYMCPVQSIGSKKGEGISFGDKGETFISGKILDIEINTKFSHSFKFKQSDSDAKNDESTIVTYELFDDNGLIVLVLTHSGFKEENETYHNITGGWPYILSNLKTYLETGKTLTEK